ncbi:hypothetical protein CIK05_05245 [Bdellovibrio sp. qaytius]|nr:hypothetical protein CIK05_05245 [Bdellovibrio sp. qaytius]
MKNFGLIVYGPFKIGSALQKLAQVKNLVSLSLLALVISFSLSAKAHEFSNEAGCLKEELVADVLKDFDLQFSESAENMKIESCNPQSLSYRIVLALLYIKHGEYNPGKASTDQAFENLFATMSPYSFVKHYIKTVKINDCKSVNYAWAYAVSNHDDINICAKKMLEWDRASSKKISAIRIASLIVHEVRHIDPSVPDHKSAEGCFKCDTSVEAKGAYFYEKEFLYNVHKYGKNFSAQERNDARYWAEFILDKNFIKRATLLRPMGRYPQQ